jgi:hypothetical protein
MANNKNGTFNESPLRESYNPAKPANLSHPKHLPIPPPPPRFESQGADKK